MGKPMEHIGVEHVEKSAKKWWNIMEHRKNMEDIGTSEKNAGKMKDLFILLSRGKFGLRLSFGTFQVILSCNQNGRFLKQTFRVPKNWNQ